MHALLHSMPPIWSQGPQPCLTQWNYEPSHVGPPKMDMSWWRVLTKHGPLEKGIANHFQFTFIHGPNIPDSYAMLLFTASDFTSITSHIHSWVLLLLWLHPFILSGVISPLISSSILGTYWAGEFIFHCPMFLPFHTVHGVLKERILKWSNRRWQEWTLTF